MEVGEKAGTGAFNACCRVEPHAGFNGPTRAEAGVDDRFHRHDSQRVEQFSRFDRIAALIIFETRHRGCIENAVDSSGARAERANDIGDAALRGPWFEQVCRVRAFDQGAAVKRVQQERPGFVRVKEDTLRLCWYAAEEKGAGTEGQHTRLHRGAWS
jgi:hypothetical protein